jgi:hypothetical protein
VKYFSKIQQIDVRLFIKVLNFWLFIKLWLFIFSKPSSTITANLQNPVLEVRQ